MIRQAISCDVCGAEKKQTNHWYVACEQGGEMRLGGWNSRMRQRPGAKHLCGQTCLHKLVDEFMARTNGMRGAAAIAENAEPAATRPKADASPVFPMQPRLVTEPAAPAPIPPQIEDAPNYASRRWRAEAWERERNRELRAVEGHARSKGI